MTNEKTEAARVREILEDYLNERGYYNNYKAPDKALANEVMRKLTTKQQKKVDEIRIEKAYRAGCCGIQIDIMRISSVFAVGQKATNQGANDDALASLIRVYVETIREN